jgi:hypothetical protein
MIAARWERQAEDAVFHVGFTAFQVGDAPHAGVLHRAVAAAEVADHVRGAAAFGGARRDAAFDQVLEQPQRGDRTAGIDAARLALQAGQAAARHPEVRIPREVLGVAGQRLAS